jgi:hypothetical protein
MDSIFDKVQQSRCVNPLLARVMSEGASSSMLQKRVGPEVVFQPDHDGLDNRDS